MDGEGAISWPEESGGKGLAPQYLVDEATAARDGLATLLGNGAQVEVGSSAARHGGLGSLVAGGSGGGWRLVFTLHGQLEERRRVAEQLVEVVEVPDSNPLDLRHVVADLNGGQQKS